MRRRDRRPEPDPNAWRLDPPAGWFIFGTHADTDEPMSFWGERYSEDGLPVWERPDD